MINKHTGIRIASTFKPRDVPLEIGQLPNEYTRKHGVQMEKTANAGMALVKAFRAKAS